MEDRIDVSAAPRGLSDLSDEATTAYRPVSALAVVGLALAGVSLLALVTPWLAPVAVFAAALCWWAAHDVGRDPTAKGGGSLAVAGLVLSALTLGAVVAKRPFADRLHLTAAAAVGDRFVELLAEGNHVGAFELSLPLADRQPTSELAESLYASDDGAGEKLAAFRARPEIVRIAQLGPPGPRRGASAAVGAGSAGRVFASVPYALPGEPLELRLRMERSGSARWGGVAWRVTDFELGAPAD